MERSGSLDDIHAGEAIEAHGPALSLTLLREDIGSAFALEEPRPEGAKRSLQLFDRRGVTLIKVVCRDMADGRAFATVRERLRIENETLPIADEQPATPATGLGRDAPAHDSPLQPFTLHDFLRAAAHQGIALAISVGNGGARLATTTVIQRVKRSSRAPWVNVLDPGLDLHLHEARLQKLAVTRRPDGDTLSWIADDGVVAVTFTVPVGASETLAKALASGETPD
jgi:putative heme degradation protein